ncbi:MAG: hypothetical protein KC503_35225 [Myxococcales bacterium]|nr:hypothetical protein [Myxococcales bacterium]
MTITHRTLTLVVPLILSACGGRAFEPLLGADDNAVTITRPAQPALALCATSDVTLGSNSEIFTFDQPSGTRSERAHVAANGVLALSRNAHVEGSVVSGGDLVLENGAQVEGDGTYGGALTLPRRATIFGALTSAAPAPAPCGCAPDIDQMFAQAAASNDNAELAASSPLAPYLVGGKLVIPRSTLVEIARSAVLYVSELTVQRGAVFALNGSNTRLDIFVEGRVTIERGAEVEAHPGVHQIWIYNRASWPIRLASSSTTCARIHAPRAAVTFDAGARVLGAVQAASITLGSKARVRFDGAEVASPAPSCVAAP